jgi:plasmid stabilization system protein ParE
VSSKSVIFHPEARLEFEEAADWYEQRRAGLGAEFVTAVRFKVQQLRVAPELWRSVRGVRRALVARFPYAVVYRETSHDVLEIVAIAHLSRQPAYWQER